jgi:hypothetical protein
VLRLRLLQLLRLVLAHLQVQLLLARLRQVPARQGAWGRVGAGGRGGEARQGEG